MGAPSNRFTATHVPMLWASLVEEFGVWADYLPANSPGTVITIQVIWKDGQSDEDVSPGRYSHIDLCNADLGQAPALGDRVQQNGRLYQVTRINSLPVNYSVLVLQELGAAL